MCALGYYITFAFLLKDLLKIEDETILEVLQIKKRTESLYQLVAEVFVL